MSFASAGSCPFRISVTPSKNSLNSSEPLLSASKESKRSVSSSRPNAVIEAMTSSFSVMAWKNSSRVMDPLPSSSMSSKAFLSAFRRSWRTSSWLCMISLSASFATLNVFSQKSPITRLSTPKVVVNTKSNQKTARYGLFRTVGWTTSRPQPSVRHMKSDSIDKFKEPNKDFCVPTSSLIILYKNSGSSPAGHVSYSCTSGPPGHSYLEPMRIRARRAKM
mmetsp:Transcript_10241/g.21693  ORF Transcript_10241/g.21693 Transcript_10241/m.21693 type:complete len:220 (+) Transcript_10241:260-919(+)